MRFLRRLTGRETARFNKWSSSGPNQPAGERGAQPSRPVSRRKSRAALARTSLETRQENDARLRLYRAGLIVVPAKSGKSARTVMAEYLLKEER